jgi:signal transduction histidine kinase
MTNLILVLSHSFSIVLTSASITWIITKSRGSNLSLAFIRCQVLLLIWLVGQLFEYTAENLLEQTLSLDVIYIAVCFIGPSFFLFSLKFSKTKRQPPFLIKIMIFLPAFILYALFVTNFAHDFFFNRYEFQVIENAYGFYLNVIITYIYILSGLLLILLKSIRTFITYKFQMWLIIWSAVIPFLLNVISLTRLPIDLTPFAFSVSSVLVLIAIHKFGFVNIMPLAMNKTIENMSDFIIVADKDKTVIFVNKAFAARFSIHQNASGTINDLFVKIQNHILPNQDSVVSDICSDDDINDIDLRLKDCNGQTYSVTKQKIYNGNVFYGYIIKLSDVTSYYKFITILSERNKALESANEKLKKLNIVTEQLAVEKEQMRISQELHNTIGHDLVNIMTLIKLSIIDKNDRKDVLDNALSLSTNLLESVRSFVGNLCVNEKISIVGRLNTLVRNMDVTHVSVELTVSGEEKDFHLFANEIVFNAVREAITNAIRHGQANQIYVVLKFNIAFIKVFIMDNGVGCSEINKHMGLTGIEKSVIQIGGQAQFRSDSKQGFSVQISIPIPEVLA